MMGVTWNMSIDSLAVCPKTNGIYRIRNTKNGRFYIGRAEGKKGFRARWGKHRNDLRRGTHHCAYLQHAFGKYGEECFIFEILELTDYGVPLKELESEYIVKLEAMSYQNGYNMVNKYSEKPKIVREHHVIAKEFELLDPEGNLVKGKNLVQFCEELGLNAGNMHNVITGRVNSCKGYKSVNPAFHLVKKEHRLLSPKGELCVFDNVHEFARKVGVSPGSMQGVLRGWKAHIRGYHLENPSPKHQKNLDRLFNKKILLNKGLGIIITFIAVKAFARKYNVSSTTLYNFFEGKGNSLMDDYNWESPTKEEMDLFHIIEEGF